MSNVTTCVLISDADANSFECLSSRAHFLISADLCRMSHAVGSDYHYDYDYDYDYDNDHDYDYDYDHD